MVRVDGEQKSKNALIYGGEDKKYVVPKFWEVVRQGRGDLYQVRPIKSRMSLPDLGGPLQTVDCSLDITEEIRFKIK